MKRYKIAVVIPKYGLVGGGERFALELTERVAMNPQYEIHVFANKWRAVSDKVIFHKVPIIPFPKFAAPLSFAYFADKKISAMNFDLVHSHERIFDADIFTLHSVPHRFWINNIRKKKIMSLYDRAVGYIEQRMVKGRCRYFLPVSTLAEGEFLKQYKVDPAKIQVIHPGTDINMFKPTHQESREKIRRTFNIEQSDIVVIFVGMNFEIKGLDALMQAAALTYSSDLKLLVVGKGNIDKYKSLAKNLGIEQRVIFAGVHTDGIENLYGAADIFAMLSKFDTFGMTVSEAMACGLPVIVSPFVGAKDLVKDGENGFIVNSGNIETVASRLSLLTDSRCRQIMGKSAYQTAVNHSWDAMAGKVAAIYESALPLADKLVKE